MVFCKRTHTRQSIDSKGYKLALGVPIYTSTIKTYTELGILPLDEFRHLSSCKYILRSNAASDFCDDELALNSNISFPKRSQSMQCCQTIGAYTADLLKNLDLDSTNVNKQLYFPPIPSWELNKAHFDIDHTPLIKSDNPNILNTLVHSYIEEKYSNYLQIFTDGSVLDNHAGAGYVIPSLDIRKSFHIGKYYSIFTAELTAILMVLNYILSFPKYLATNVLVCVDSKSVLQSLNNNSGKIRREMIFEINYLIHQIILGGTHLCFCWVPSHVGFLYNDWADRAAKNGASKSVDSICLSISLSLQEYYHLVEQKTWLSLKSTQPYMNSSLNCSWCKHIIKEVYKEGIVKQNNVIVSLICRLKLNSIRTKYNKNIKCICGEKISPEHIILHCKGMEVFLPKHKETSLDGFFSINNSILVISTVKDLLNSPIANFL